MSEQMAIAVEKRLVKHSWKGRGGFLPMAIVEHMMQGSLEETWQYFDGTNPEGEYPVSAHYGVARDGRVWQFVDEEDTAWANGVLQNPDTAIDWVKEVYEEQVNCNLVTLAVEYEGFSGEPLTEAQYKAALALHRQLLERWDIEPDTQHIIGHDRLDSLERTANPGPAFPWQRLLDELVHPEVEPQAAVEAPEPMAEIEGDKLPFSDEIFAVPEDITVTEEAEPEAPSLDFLNDVTVRPQPEAPPLDFLSEETPKELHIEAVDDKLLEVSAEQAGTETDFEFPFELPAEEEKSVAPEQEVQPETAEVPSDAWFTDEWNLDIPPSALSEAQPPAEPYVFGGTSPLLYEDLDFNIPEDLGMDIRPATAPLEEETKEEKPDKEAERTPAIPDFSLEDLPEASSEAEFDDVATVPYVAPSGSTVPPPARPPSPNFDIASEVRPEGPVPPEDEVEEKGEDIEFHYANIGGGTVAVELANIRTQPSYDPDTIQEQAEYGQRYNFDGWIDGPELRGVTRWYHIVPPEGNGWVHSTLVNLDRPFEP